jgi:hypothetical protein
MNLKLFLIIFGSISLALTPFTATAPFFYFDKKGPFDPPSSFDALLGFAFWGSFCVQTICGLILLYFWFKMKMSPDGLRRSVLVLSILNVLAVPAFFLFVLALLLVVGGPRMAP